MDNIVKESLMAFDLRVLDNGRCSSTATLEELKDKLFFNQIYVSNTDEMFEKYPMFDLKDTYVSGMQQVLNNVQAIVDRLQRITGLELSRKDSFERRYVIETELNAIEVTEHFANINSVRYKFKSGELYYISLFDNDSISISYVDKKRDVYSKVLGMNKTFWKTDECIREYIKKSYKAKDTIAVKVTTAIDNANVVTKVEYNGSVDTMKQIMSMFGPNVLVMFNPMVYTKDIGKAISSAMPKKKESQLSKKLNINNLLKGDHLMEYPTESFETYLNLLRSLVDYPDTKELFLTIYRIGDDPSLFYILKDARRKGIKVNVNVELEASGEKLNKFWFNELETAGVNVTAYASGVLKVHTKITLAKMKDGSALAQIGTGNYNSSTTSQYTDLSLITGNDEICRMIEKVFDIFDGKEHQTFNDELLVTRYNARETLYRLIEEEGSKCESGYICIKCNSMNDPEIIYHLDNAAQKGCKIDLLVRGICTYIPKRDNVMVKSTIWDKLEHSRVFAFGAINPTVYIGSLDLLTNKLNGRIETMVKINEISALREIATYLNRYVTNTHGAYIMQPDGSYLKQS